MLLSWENALFMPLACVFVPAVAANAIKEDLKTDLKSPPTALVGTEQTFVSRGLPPFTAQSRWAPRIVHARHGPNVQLLGSMRKGSHNAEFTITIDLAETSLA